MEKKEETKEEKERREKRNARQRESRRAYAIAAQSCGLIRCRIGGRTFWE